MHAQSLVVATRTLADGVDGVLDAVQLAGDDSVCRRGLAQLRTLCTVDALLAAGTPLPVPDAASRPSVDEAVAELAARLYADRRLERDALDADLVERALEADRVRSVGSFLVIPLSAGDAGARNWRPVLRVLMDRLARIAERCDNVVARLETARSVEPVTLRTWRTVRSSVRETRTAVRVQLARQDRLRRLYNRPSADPAEFAAWTLDRLTDTATES